MVRVWPGCFYGSGVWAVEMTTELAVEEYRELLTHAVDIVMVVDESGTIQYQSPSVQRITGYAPDERVGNSAFERVHPEDEQKALDTFSEALESSAGRVLGTEFRYRHKDGSWVWLEARATDQTVTAVDGFVVSLRDITQRKEYEAQLKRERDRFEEFASVVSHDLRNPLNVIEGRLELAQAACESEHLDAIGESLGRVNELIDDLLTLAREGETDVLLDGVRLQEITEGCWENIATDHATVTVETAHCIVADESQLKQVFENLFRNAIEHGGADVTITVGDLEEGFYVEDDGRGIPDEAQDSLFEYGCSTKPDGTGFGLAIVDRIVENHGWQLTVGEGKDGGARFEITGVDRADN